MLIAVRGSGLGLTTASVFIATTQSFDFGRSEDQNRFRLFCYSSILTFLVAQFLSFSPLFSSNFLLFQVFNFVLLSLWRACCYAITVFVSSFFSPLFLCFFVTVVLYSLTIAGIVFFTQNFLCFTLFCIYCSILLSCYSAEFSILLLVFLASYFLVLSFNSFNYLHLTTFHCNFATFLNLTFGIKYRLIKQ